MRTAPRRIKIDTLVTGEEVKKTLQLHTLKRYARILAMQNSKVPTIQNKTFLILSSLNKYKLERYKLKHLIVTLHDIKMLG